jgi:hypothetical protein
MDFVIENKVIHIDYINIDKILFNYYSIDLELLFSKSPFINQVLNCTYFHYEYYRTPMSSV